MNANLILRPWPYAAGLALSLLSLPALAIQTEFDVFNTNKEVPLVAAGGLLGGSEVCEFGALGRPLLLQEAVERTLCNNPKTHEAWSNVKLQAAAIGTAKGAFLPTSSVSWQGLRDSSRTDVQGLPQYNSDSLEFVRSSSFSLNWVLYDFGVRSAALSNARHLFAAARANQDAVLQNSFALAAKDYYAASAAQAVQVNAQDILHAANDILQAANERVKRGIAPITDALQAQTARAQAVFDLAKAQGELQIARGTLAFDLGLQPDAGIELPGLEESVAPDAQFNASISALMEEAQRTHPSILAAQAQMQASQDKVSQSRSEGLPNISFVSKYSQNNQPAQLGLGAGAPPTTGRQWYVGVAVTLPLFEGFVRNYQVRQASAQVEVQRAALDGVRSQVGLDVWVSFHSLSTATENLNNSATSVDIAQRSETAAASRYRAGVGNIVELLSVQSALATSRKQHIQALTDWRSARLQLAGKLGKLDMKQVSQR